MTNQEILTKAVEKAGFGWLESQGYNSYTVWNPVNALDTLIILEEKDSHEKRQFNYQAIIFNHDFAKALWPGTDLNSLAGTYPHEIPAWQYRLQQMVIADDPIKYLGENI